jgi:hypothetical protein
VVFAAAALLGLDPYLETAGKLFAQAVSGFDGLSTVLQGELQSPLQPPQN